MNKPLNFDKFTFRASCIGKIMTEPQGKSNFDKWSDVNDKYLKANEKYNSDLIEVNEKIENTPPEKREQKTYQNLKDKKAKIEESFVDKVVSLKREADRLMKIRDEVQLSKTCISYLIQIYAEAKFNREYEIRSKYIDKGNQVEEKAIEMLSEIDGEFYVKNDVRKYDEFFEGECDVDYSEFDKKILDTKASWDVFTFQKKTLESVDMDYWWQGQTYMHLYGANKYVLAYLLLNTPEGLIEDEKRRLLWSMGTDKKDTDAYEQGCKALEYSLVYDDIPQEERIIKIAFLKNDQAIKDAQVRVVACRKWLNEYAISEFNRTRENTEIVCNIEYGNSTPSKTELETIIKAAIVSSNGIVKEYTAKEVADALEPGVELPIKTVEDFNDSTTDEFEQDNETVSESEPEPEPIKEAVQIDLEDSIPESYPGSLSEMLAGINSLKTMDEIIAKRNELRDLFEKFPELESALKSKRDELKPAEIEKPIVAPKRPAPIAVKVSPAPAPVSADPEIVVYDSPLEGEIRVQLSECKTHLDVKALYAKHMVFIKGNAKLMVDFIETGKKRTTHPLQ